MTNPVQGRRLPDTPYRDLPEGEILPGDYWKCTGVILSDSYSQTNLTGTVWMFMSPDGNGIGTLVSHTVREEDDGTISIRPNDGSSNSVLHEGGAQQKTWHGYVEHGVWTSV